MNVSKMIQMTHLGNLYLNLTLLIVFDVFYQTTYFTEWYKATAFKGLIHTRHNIAIKRYFWAMDFNDNQGKLLKTYLELFCLFIYLDLFICQELTLAFRHPWLKNIFLSQYLFIAILCVKMSRVNKAKCMQDR